MKFPSAGKLPHNQTSSVSNPSTKSKLPLPLSRRSQVRPKNPSRAPTKSRVPRPKPGGPRPGSKTAKALALLKRPQGASIEELQRVTGWQPHSVRGFLSGIVARKMGFNVSSTKTESGERRYAVKP
jgi:hypothetical protein